MELVSRKLTVGELIEELTAQVGRHWLLIVLGYGTFAIASSLLNAALYEWGNLPLDDDGIYPAADLVTMLLSAVAGFFMYYLIIERVMIREGLLAPGSPRHFGSMIGATILSGLGTVLGFLAVIVPGFILMARWSLIGPCIVAMNDRAKGGMRESWEATEESQASLAIMMVILLVGQYALLLGALAAVGGFSEDVVLPGMNPDYLVQHLATTLIGSVNGGLTLLLSVGTYRLLASDSRQLDTVFA